MEVGICRSVYQSGLHNYQSRECRDTSGFCVVNLITYESLCDRTEVFWMSSVHGRVFYVPELCTSVFRMSSVHGRVFYVPELCTLLDEQRSRSCLLRTGALHIKVFWMSSVHGRVFYVPELCTRIYMGVTPLRIGALHIKAFLGKYDPIVWLCDLGQYVPIPIVAFVNELG